jgi:hypothetical protein
MNDVPRDDTTFEDVEAEELTEAIDPRTLEPSLDPSVQAAGGVVDELVHSPIFGETPSQPDPVNPSGPPLPVAPFEADVPDRDFSVPPPSANVLGSVRLARPEQGVTADELLWTMIRNRTNAIAFNNYFRFVDDILSGDSAWLNEQTGGTLDGSTQSNLRNLGSDGFWVLKDATQLFLMHEAGIIASPALQPNYDTLISPNAELTRRNLDPLPADWVNQLRTNYYEQLDGSMTRVMPYFNLILSRLKDLASKDPTEVFANAYGVLPGWVTGPLAIELIWSYWHEEGMLAQAFGAISHRFQNRRLAGRQGPDPLARLEIDPLRRLNHYIWGWVSNEPFRTSVRRRAFEYDHHYGVTLLGKAIGPVEGADSRSKFIEAFHNLLYTAAVYHLQSDDLTVQADGFPVLNALRETQLVLTEGAHNQYGDMPWVARVEMMMMQWMLGRPEMREFLGGRIMVPYKEPWMDRVDSVKSMLGWTPTNVTHFRDLGVFGEQILLGVRYGSWAKEIRPEAAANWANYWRPEIQGYVHAYRAATGVDLRQGVEATMPGILLQERLGPTTGALGSGVRSLAR